MLIIFVRDQIHRGVDPPARREVLRRNVLGPDRRAAPGTWPADTRAGDSHRFA